MGKLFSKPEYVEKIVKDILKDPKILDQIEKSEAKPELNKDKPSENEKDEHFFFKMWLKDQLERYPKAKEAVEPYMKAQGYILPVDVYEFLRWFVKEAKKEEDYLFLLQMRRAPASSAPYYQHKYARSLPRHAPCSA